MDFTPNEYTGTIWNWFKANSSFTNEGIAALMGNMYAESGCTPYACQPSRPKNICTIYIENVDNDRINRYQFAHGGCSSTGGYTATQLGYGLCQWTLTERKEAFHKYFFPNYPTTMSGTIEDIYKQMEYAMLELTGTAQERDPYGILNYNTVGTILKTSHNINDCSDICLEIYENPLDQSQAVHELRRKLSRQVYSEYHGGSFLTITLNETGNGIAYVDDYYPMEGQSVRLQCIPNTGESLVDIIGTTITGYPVALYVIQDQTFTMPNESIIIDVTFTGTTPPVPPTPIPLEKHRMPIWMYPRLRRI